MDRHARKVCSGVSTAHTEHFHVAGLLAFHALSPLRRSGSLAVEQV